MNIRTAQATDIRDMVAIAETKRIEYEAIHRCSGEKPPTPRRPRSYSFRNCSPVPM